MGIILRQSHKKCWFSHGVVSYLRALTCFGAVLVQTGGRCVDARFQALLGSTYPQLMLKTGTGEGRKEGGENKKAVTLVML
jgi:hypothetical protein